MHKSFELKRSQIPGTWELFVLYDTHFGVTFETCLYANTIIGTEGDMSNIKSTFLPWEELKQTTHSISSV